MFASHVEQGGFYADDWSNALFYRTLGYGDMAIDYWRDLTPWRPVLALLLPGPHALFGLNATYHLVAALLLAILASLAFFVFLRALGIEFPHALALALLALVFPWSDALRLWATASINNAALIAYFLGSAAALRALTLEPVHRNRRIAFHGLSAVLYIVSLLTYEVAAPALLLSGPIYRARVSWRSLRARWLLDASLVVVWLAVVIVPTSRARDVGTWHDRAADIPDFVVQGSSLFASTFLPREVSSAAVKLLALAAVGVVVGAALWRVRSGEEPELRKWLRRACASMFAVGLGYLMFLGYGLFPLSEGLENRVNALAAFGFVATTYSVIVLSAVLVCGTRARWAAAAIATATVLVGLGFIERVRVDIAQYDASAEEQSDQLETLRQLLPRLPRGSTIFTFGHPNVAARGVPIFGAPWVLTAAVDLLWNDPSLTAVPAEGKGVSCARDGARVAGFDTGYVARYGRMQFVDLSLARVRQIASRQECLDALALFR